MLIPTNPPLAEPMKKVKHTYLSKEEVSMSIRPFKSRKKAKHKFEERK
jgi:hypothetical protein